MNASLAADEMLSGCQIARFLVLHKELDADDGETDADTEGARGISARSMKIWLARCTMGRETVTTETEVTYEDGRKGSIKATLVVVAGAVVPRAMKVAAE